MSELVITKQPGKWRLRWAITKHELRNLIRHPYYVVSMSIPIFMSLIFGIVLPALDDDEPFVIVIYDAGSSTWTETLQSWPDADIQIVDTEMAIHEALAAGVTGGIIIPPDFDTAVRDGQIPELTAYLNDDAPSKYIESFKRLLSEDIWALRYETAPAQINWQSFTAEAGSFLFFSIENYILTVFTLTGLVMTTLGLLPQLMLEKRENGSLPALMASPIDASDLMFGHGLTFFICAGLISLILLVLNQGWTGNNVITAISVSLITTILICIGLIASLWAQSKAQCNSITAVGSIIFILPSWFLFTPLENLPGIVALVVRLLPTYHFANAFIHSLTNTATWETVGINFIFLLGFLIIMLGAVNWRLRQQPLWQSQNLF